MLPPTHPAVKDIQQKEIHEVSGDVIPINMVKGIGHLRDPRLNKVFEKKKSIFFYELRVEEKFCLFHDRCYI